MLASLTRESGTNTISREGVQRKMVVQANVAGRDLSRVVEDLKARIAAEVPMHEGYSVVYSGQFESAEEAARTITLLSAGVVVGIFLLLVMAFGSVRNALLKLINLPLALIGGVVAVALGSGVVSVASLVGFITLFGIATRNGILMVRHFEHLMTGEGKILPDAVVHFGTKNAGGLVGHHRHAAARGRGERQGARVSGAVLPLPFRLPFGEGFLPVSSCLLGVVAAVR